jgi:hypothetical protein
MAINDGAEIDMTREMVIEQVMSSQSLFCNPSHADRIFVWRDVFQLQEDLWSRPYSAGFRIPSFDSIVSTLEMPEVNFPVNITVRGMLDDIYHIARLF